MKKKDKNMGYIVPDAYFEDFELKLHSRLKKDGERQSGYRIPENYFDDFERVLMNRIKGSKANRLRRFVIRYSAAAVVVIMLLAGWWRYRQFSEEVAIRQWLEENYMELDACDLTAALDDSEEVVWKGLTDKDVEEYLIEQDTDELFMEF